MNEKFRRRALLAATGPPASWNNPVRCDRLEVRAAASLGGVIAMGSSHSLALAALVVWLLAEALGAFMLRNWVVSGAARRRREHPEGMSLPVLLGHAGLNLCGLSCWIAFVTTRSAIPAWLAICLLVPGIGLGVSTLSVWTPYPVARRAASVPADERQHARAIPDHVLARSLEDDAAASRLIDELLARNLAAEAEQPRTLRLDPRTVVPLAHGVLAVATFLLAVLAAVSAR